MDLCTIIFDVDRLFKKQKKLTKEYYKGIIPILIIYILVSIITLIFKKFYFEYDISIITCIKDILNFTAANYSWYVEMYIGLFLFIPFLNIIWNNLKTKKEKKILLISLIFCVTIPTLLNNFNLSLSNGFKEIFLALESKDKIVPSWWFRIYPIMYYFIGCYIYEYKDDFKKKPIHYFMILMILAVIFSIWNHFRCNGGIWRNEDFSSNYYGYQNVITSILLFLCISKINFVKLPQWSKKLITKLSIISFGIYLISYIFDVTFYYSILRKLVPVVSDRWIYHPIMIFSVFLCSSVSSLILYFIKDKVISKIIKIKS